VFDYAARRQRLAERMEAEGVDALFLAPSADLEYLTGVERQVPNFGEVSYAHGWVSGAFLRPHADPVFVFPRMFATFDLPHPPEGEIIVVNETEDGFAAFERVAKGVAGSGIVAVGDRVWGEAVLNLGRIVGFERLRTGSHLVNRMRRVKDAQELEAMGRAIATVDSAMAAVTPLAVPGVSMGELVEAVEHELRRAGSRCPSFTTHMFTGFAPVLDGDALVALAPVSAPRVHRRALGVFDLQVFDVEAEGVGVAPELEGVAACLVAGNLGGVDAFEVEDVAGCLAGGLVVAELDAGADGDVVHVEGEAVVGEVAGLVGVPEVGAVEAGSFFGVGVPGEVLADDPDRALEVVVVDRAADRLRLEARTAAIVGGEAPPEDVLGAVDPETDATRIRRRDVAAVDVDVLGVVEPDRVVVLAAGVDERDAVQIELRRCAEPVPDHRLARDRETLGRLHEIARLQVRDGSSQLGGVAHFDRS
jgi:hypothetical protein